MQTVQDVAINTIDKIAIEQPRVRVLPDGRMTREDAATYLGVKPKTLSMWQLHGKGPASTLVGGRRFYFMDVLDAYVRGDIDEAGEQSSENANAA